MANIKQSKVYDAVVIGSGVSGSFLALELVKSGMEVLLLEAGEFFSRSNFPQKEIDANSKLYWGGGIEFNTDANIALLRPKVVGGGSIVNQALLDRFDDDALSSWKSQSGVSFFESGKLDKYYAAAEAELNIETIPEKYRNENGKIFAEGFKANGYQYAPLTRAQKNCRFEEGNDCIECLSGCRADSKQSMLITTLKAALGKGLHIKSLFEVGKIENNGEEVKIHGLYLKKYRETFKARKLILAAGAIGNTKLLLSSGFKKKLPALGRNFFTHPQFMVLALFNREISAHKGPFQSLKSADPNFRKKGFKLENVFGPPVAISMLLQGFGSEHMRFMKRLSQMACIEVAIRDTNPGIISLDKKGKVRIDKKLNDEDRKRKAAGVEAIQNIFSSQGAEEVFEGRLPIGLHLMGGLGIGENSETSVVNPEFQIHCQRNIFVADSSIFPNAPGINPSLTIMALSIKAAQEILRG
ncbi:MAG: GMC family oxidoreductase [Halobacteriovoraceae bacterium]|jgi:choline dehydrogenase-like flavoprotein|nr:GMC family oxidoreductase [Halobacteriovoraceae bacterium]MBT5093224.1 GMC family oxidoreductase [Halobacteriovoraceae bacterium]